MGTFKIIAKTATKAAKKTSSRVLFAILLIVLVVTLATTASIVFLVIKPTIDNVNSLSNEVGESVGQAVAFAVEPFYLPEDILIGLHEGHEAGLSAEDTTVTAENPIESLGNGVLEVFETDVELVDPQIQGKDLPTGPSYAALYIYKGKMVFTVDLNAAKIQYRENEVIISVPEPMPQIKWDGNGPEMVAEYKSLAGVVFSTPSDGITASLNSEAQMYEKTPQELEDYAMLREMAKEEAAVQLHSLAEAVIVGNKKITVEFIGEKE